VQPCVKPGLRHEHCAELAGAYQSNGYRSPSGHAPAVWCEGSCRSETISPTATPLTRVTEEETIGTKPGKRMYPLCTRSRSIALTYRLSQDKPLQSSCRDSYPTRTLSPCISC
jgi:hypothetical protein